jgi:hypothetical protein
MDWRGWHDHYDRPDARMFTFLGYGALPGGGAATRRRRAEDRA